MGIEGLTKLLKDRAPTSITEIELSSLAGKSVAIDVSAYLHQYAYNSDNKGKGSYIRGFFEMIVVLTKHNILPIFVFDGKAASAKAETLAKRQGAKDAKYDKITDLSLELLKIVGVDASMNFDKDKPDAEIINFEQALKLTTKKLTPEDFKKISDLQQEIAHQEKNIITITGNMFTELVELFTLCGVPYLKATGEADFLCVKLCKEGIASAVFSEDMDILTHGAELLIRGINDNDFRKNGKLRCYTLSKILDSFKMTQAEFIDTCIMCSCDYATSPPGVGPKTAFSLISKYRTIDEFVKQCNDGKIKYDISSFTYQRAREEFKKSDLETLPTRNDLLQKPRKSDAILKFITTYSNYTNKTALKKLEEMESSTNAKTHMLAQLPKIKISVPAPAHVPNIVAKPKVVITIKKN